LFVRLFEYSQSHTGSSRPLVQQLLQQLLLRESDDAAAFKSRRLDLQRKSDGLWLGVAHVGYDSSGKPLRKYVSSKKRPES